MDPKEVLDHQFVTAAYIVTWVIQLSYLAFLAVKWRSEKRKSRSANSRQERSAPR